MPVNHQDFTSTKKYKYRIRYQVRYFDKAGWLIRACPVGLVFISGQIRYFLSDSDSEYSELIQYRSLAALGTI
jgi:hypothetical protein